MAFFLENDVYVYIHILQNKSPTSIHDASHISTVRITHTSAINSFPHRYSWTRNHRHEPFLLVYVHDDEPDALMNLFFFLRISGFGYYDCFFLRLHAKTKQKKTSDRTLVSYFPWIGSFTFSCLVDVFHAMQMLGQNSPPHSPPHSPPPFFF